MDMWLCFSECEVGEAPANMPWRKSVHRSDSPRVRILVFLLYWCSIGPLTLLCGVTHLLVIHLAHIPEQWAVPGSPFPAKAKLQMALLPPGVHQWKRCGECEGYRQVFLFWSVSNVITNTRRPLWYSSPSFSLPPTVWWGFSWGRKCARISPINPVHCAFLWRAVHWQTLPLFIIDQTAFLPVSMDILCWLSKNLHADFVTVDTLSSIHHPHFSAQLGEKLLLLWVFYSCLSHEGNDILHSFATRSQCKELFKLSEKQWDFFRVCGSVS